MKFKVYRNMHGKEWEIMKRFFGNFVPVPTPALEDGGMDEARFEAQIDRVLSAGAHGLYLCGGTGDGSKLTPRERTRAAELAIPIVKQHHARIIVHVGAAPLSVSRELAAHAEKLGADGVASVPPTCAPHELNRQWYEELGKASALPVFLYFIPSVTLRAAPYEELADLLCLPNVAGLKITDDNAYLMGRIKRALPGKIVYSGCDEQILFSMMAGADGVIGTWANLVPKFFTAVWALVPRGEIEAARRLYDRFTVLMDRALTYGMMASFESLMAERGYALRCFRAPSAWNPGAVPGEAAREMLGLIEESEAAAGMATAPPAKTPSASDSSGR